MWKCWLALAVSIQLPMQCTFAFNDIKGHASSCMYVFMYVCT